MVEKNSVFETGVPAVYFVNFLRPSKPEGDHNIQDYLNDVNSFGAQTLSVVMKKISWRVYVDCHERF